MSIFRSSPKVRRCGIVHPGVGTLAYGFGYLRGIETKCGARLAEITFVGKFLPIDMEVKSLLPRDTSREAGDELCLRARRTAASSSIPRVFLSDEVLIKPAFKQTTFILLQFANN